MKVMTFNLRFENDLDAENAWVLRREFVVGTILKAAPCLLGTQEGTPAQLRYLQDRLAGYAMHAPGRLWDETCQYPTLFYRKDRFSVVDGGEFWLSATPEVHRSKDWDSAFPRMMSQGTFRDMQRDGAIVWVGVTHLDHIGKTARREQAAVIARRLTSCPGARILLGDFNDGPGSDAHTILTAPDTGLYDSWQALGREEGKESMTFHAFLGTPLICRMDWVLASHSFVVRDAFIVRDHRDGFYPSDHFPYVVDLEWAGNRSGEPGSSPSSRME
ncbi:MAG: endonuclease/exonuclease/phosphatase family protein [Syntrophobacter sp.]